MKSANRRVLIILYYWPPAGGGGVQRWLKFTKYLVSVGWDPIVYAPENAAYPLIDESLIDEIGEGVEVITQPIFEVRKLYERFTGQRKRDADSDNLFYQDRSEMSLMKRVALFIRSNLFVPDARSPWITPSVRFLTGWLAENPVDAIISTGPPHSCHLIGLQLKKRTGVPWMADFRDPWTDIEFFEHLNLSKASRKKHFRLQKAVLETADRVVTVSWAWAELFKKYGARKVTTITNGYDSDDTLTVSRHVDEDVFVIASVGTLELDRNPTALWETLANIVKDKVLRSRKLRIDIVGKSDLAITAALPESLKPVIRFTGYIPHAEALEKMFSADVLLLIQNQAVETNTKGRIPGKVFEYLASGRPILMLGDAQSDLARVLKDNPEHGVFGHDDVNGIEHFLVRVIGSERKERSSGDMETYSRAYLTGLLGQELDQMIDIERET